MAITHLDGLEENGGIGFLQDLLDRGGDITELKQPEEWLDRFDLSVYFDDRDAAEPRCRPTNFCRLLSRYPRSCNRQDIPIRVLIFGSLSKLFGLEMFGFVLRSVEPFNI